MFGLITDICLFAHKFEKLKEWVAQLSSLSKREYCGPRLAYTVCEGITVRLATKLCTLYRLISLLIVPCVLCLCLFSHRHHLLLNWSIFVRLTTWWCCSLRSFFFSHGKALAQITELLLFLKSPTFSAWHVLVSNLDLACFFLLDLCFCSFLFHMSQFRHTSTFDSIYQIK